MSVGNFVQSGIREGVFTARTATNLADKEGYIVRFTGSMSATEPRYPLVAIVGTPTTDLIAGVLENGGDGSGTECTVSVRPLSTNVPFRCVAGGTITAGALLTVKSDGTVQAANAGDAIIGRAMEAATATTTASGTTVLYVKVMGNPMGAYSTSYSWWTGTGVTLTDTGAAFTFETGTTNGATFGSAVTDKVSLYGVTPAVQPAHANQTAVTDNSGGSVSDATAAAVTNIAATTDNSTGAAGNTVAAGAGVHTIAIPITLAQITGAGDVLTTYTPGYKFKILSVDAAVTEAVTTPGKAATLNLEIGTTNLTGGAVALDSAGTATLGTVVAGTAVTGDNTGSASATISVEASSVTAFAEGAVVLLIKIQNMDTADAIASFAAKLNTLRTAAGVINDNYAKTTELTNALRSACVSVGVCKGSA